MSKAPVDVSEPSAQDLIESADSRNLFSSNLLRLQITELLEKVTPKYEKLKKVNEFLKVLTSNFILNPEVIPDRVIPSSEEFSTRVFTYNHPLSWSAFPFKTPFRVEIVGSFQEKTIVKPFMCIDMAVVFPKESFGPSDYQNGAYLDRRNICAAILHDSLLEPLSSLATVSLSHVPSRPGRACVDVRLKAEDSSAWTVRLLPVADFEAGLWPLEKVNAGSMLFKDAGEDAPKNKKKVGAVLEPNYSQETYAWYFGLRDMLNIIHGHQTFELKLD